MQAFRGYLKNRVILFDGGLGTEIYRRGIYINRCYDELNLSERDLILQVHRDYIDAGADVIETNTFGANRLKLSKYGFGDRLGDINHEGARIALEAARGNAWVAGSIGPPGTRMEPWGALTRKEARDIFREQAIALLGGGVDLFILETFVELASLEEAVRAVREVTDTPVIAQLTIREDGTTLLGTPVKMYTERMSAWDVDAIGLNCSVGPEAMLAAVETMVPYTDRPISAMPNAGTPRTVEGRSIYLTSPDYFAEYVRRFVRAGVKIIGGCCGTTPGDIRQAKTALRSMKPVEPARRREEKEPERTEVECISLEDKSRLSAKISDREFVRLVEIVPPRGWNPAKALAAAAALEKAGVDAINIPDGPRASSRMSPLALAISIERETGMESLLHYCCRDRNLLGMQSDLLGAYSLGIRNILVITGDPPKLGDYPHATGVFDVDAIGLLRMVQLLNRGTDIGGNTFRNPTGFLIGVGVNPQAPEPAHEIERFHRKVESGAEFAITQPVFDPQTLLGFLESISSFRIPVIAGIWPLTSLRNAEFLRSEVPGVSIPERVMERMRDAEGRGEAGEEGIRIARECLSAVKAHVEGVQVNSPFGKYGKALRILEDI